MQDHRKGETQEEEGIFFLPPGFLAVSTSAAVVRYLLAAAGERAGISKRVSTQLLRDTCAVRLIKAGEPIEIVLKKLGLSETTWEDAKEKYLKLTSKAL